MGDDVEGEADPDSRRLVALYDFDPTTIDWPFRRQRPLPLTTGQVIQVIHDDGSDWALAHLVGQPDVKGYFPKNYTVSVAEYHDMMQDYEQGITGEADEAPQEQGELDTPVNRAPPNPRAVEGPLPQMDEVGVNRAISFGASEAGPQEDPELVIQGLADYPVLEAQPPLGTTFELNKSRMLREMPAVPAPAPEEPGPPEDDLAAAREELERELAAIRDDPNAVQGGNISISRCSTPATQAMTRPDHDYVRRHLPMDLQQRYLKKVSPLSDIVRKGVKVAWQDKPAYPTDMRARSTTRRLAAGIEPGIMRMALQRATASGAKWTQMFRPGFNDIVNESFKVGCNSCILSNLYLNDKQAREQFQKLHVQDVSGTLWFELQRRKEHLFYRRMDFVDVMMCHPEAWSFPDTSRVVSANPGEAINPFHGWFAQNAIDTDREMEDVEFKYTLRLRAFPEQTFQALSLGKIPEWILPALTLHTEAQQDELPPPDDDDAAGADSHGKAIPMDNNLLLEAGLEDDEDLYVKVDSEKLARIRTVGPDVLDAKMTSHTIKGVNAMRIFLRSRGAPDNMKQPLVTPKMVKDMAQQLGIGGDYSHYWYAMFALRYPLAPEWETYVKNDTRWYIHLPSDIAQPSHPLIKEFRNHLSDTMKNEFLWDYRGFVKMKCSECGIPDAVIWCPQCTDYYCASCFLSTHKSERGRKHWPMPIPGSRYLTGSEAARLAEQVPMLNVGFSNRRRFLARDNQSDKNGSKNGDSWLFFHADTFQAALSQAPEKHWYVKRLKPPRLSPDAKGYYYNFASDVIADDDSHIMTKAHEQKAISLLQKNIRGALTRKFLRQKTEATIVIQKCKQMWDVQKLHGNNGRNAAILKSWYRKHAAKKNKEKLEYRITRIQSIWRGCLTRKEFREMMRTTTRFQATFRGLLHMRRHQVLVQATVTIQSAYRGHLYGRRPMQEQRHAASRAQAMMRGKLWRQRLKKMNNSAAQIQAHSRAMMTRLLIGKMRKSCITIQRNWRRFQAQLHVKLMLYEKLEEIRVKRQEILKDKLQEAAASIIQTNYRRHRDYQVAVHMRREKGEADKRTSTMLVALFSATANMRHYIHPWWRHLPPEVQEVLQQIKGSLQRTIALVPITGKLANEELGRRGLRVSGAKELHYDQTGKDPDLASHMLLSITRHLLSHVPAEFFAPTVKWACFALSHQAVLLNQTQGFFPKEEIPVGKDLPKHPGDSLATLWTDFGTIKHHHDWLVTCPDESLPTLILSGLPPHHRHVFLTAEVLVTMRQALDSPSISTDDHLKFQGLDAQAGAQLMEVLGSEMDHRLPLEWPKTHGTVAALAAQMSSHVVELTPEKPAEKAGKEVDKKETGAAKKKGAAKKETAGKEEKSKPKSKTAKAKAEKSAKADDEILPTEPEEEASTDMALAHFNRTNAMRLVQQVGYLMRDQDALLQSVLQRVDDPGATNTSVAQKGQGIRQSRYLSVTDKLFEMADRATHDHCSFALAVTLFHMVLRGLMLRLLYHRAAIAIQCRFRYFKKRGQVARAFGPAITIQRCWRGLRDSLRVMRMDNAASMIQASYKAWHWNRRRRIFVAAVIKAQRVWTGAVQRKWMRTCHESATTIQKNFRGMMVRLVSDKGGLALAKKHQAEIGELMKRKSSMAESTFIARMANATAKARIAMHKHRERLLDVKRMSVPTLRYKQTRATEKPRKLAAKGSVQAARGTVFEPVVTAQKKLNRGGTRLGAQSRVLAQLNTAKRAFDRSIPQERTFEPHVAARRGRNAVAARRLAKRPVRDKEEGVIDNGMFEQWLSKQFAVKR